MNDLFPRTTVSGVSLPRLLVGTNWILGYSHRSSAQDKHIRNRNNNAKAVADILEVFVERGVDAIMGLFGDSPFAVDGIKMAEDRTGKKITIIDTPGINVDNTKEGYKITEDVIKRSRRLGATFCLPHHNCVEQLVNKNTRTMERLPDYLNMIRENDMIPGLSAHMPELIVYSDEQGYDVETYIQIYNSMGFLMQVEIEYIHNVIWNAKKPVMTIKPMAAGRMTPFVGLSFSFATLRPCDMVTVGCMTPEEAVEDVEIALAAIERRKPDLSGRDSPQKSAIMQD